MLFRRMMMAQAAAASSIIAGVPNSAMVAIFDASDVTTITYTTSPSITAWADKLGSLSLSQSGSGSNYPQHISSQYISNSGTTNAGRRLDRTITAGTLGSSMRVFIRARRASGETEGVLFEGSSGTGEKLGVFGSGSGTANKTLAGSATTHVDNGSSLTTRGDLYTALASGGTNPWCTVEFRNADLSLWTRISAPSYVSDANYHFTGDYVRIAIMTEANASTYGGTVRGWMDDVV